MWPNVANFLKSLFSIGQNFVPIGAIFDVIGQIFIFINDQILKIM